MGNGKNRTPASRNEVGVRGICGLCRMGRCDGRRVSAGTGVSPDKSLSSSYRKWRFRRQVLFLSISPENPAIHSPLHLRPVASITLVRRMSGGSINTSPFEAARRKLGRSIESPSPRSVPSVGTPEFPFVELQSDHLARQRQGSVWSKSALRLAEMILLAPTPPAIVECELLIAQRRMRNER